VESALEIETLRTLGISHMQGYYLGQPMPLEQAARMHLH
jgi:EAL domain-containing protein (putative c-di-GMP-specific phosphodiesterase class I)